MAKHYFISFVGPDRPGLIDDLSQIVLEKGGNWMGSRMAHLGGMFAGVARVNIDEDDLASLDSALQRMPFENGTINVVADQSQSSADNQDALLYHVEIVANDRPGILQEVTHIISSNGLNIEELESRIEDGAMSSGTLFKCDIIISCENEGQADNAHEALEALTGEIFIDWRLKAKPREA